MEKLNAKGLVGLGQKRSQIKARELVAHSNLVGVNNMKNTHIKNYRNYYTSENTAENESSKVSGFIPPKQLSLYWYPVGGGRDDGPPGGSGRLGRFLQDVQGCLGLVQADFVINQSHFALGAAKESKDFSLFDLEPAHRQVAASCERSTAQLGIFHRYA